MRFRSPLILPKVNINKKGNNSKNNLNTHNDNSFGCRFFILKQSYLNQIKKSNSQVECNTDNNNNINSSSKKLISDIDTKINKNEDYEKRRKKFILQEAVYNQDYLTKFKKIKINLYKNKFKRQKTFEEKNNESNKKNIFNIKNIQRNSTTIQNDDLDYDNLIKENNLWGSDINVKNDLNFDIGVNNEGDSDDEIELEPERERYREMISVSIREKDKKNKKESMYITELQNNKNNNIEYPLTINYNKNDINEKTKKDTINIKRIKLNPEKYKNPFVFKRYSSVNNISHFHKIYRSYKSICRKHFVKGNSPSYVFIKSCDKERIICNPLGLIKRWGDENSLDINNQHTGDIYANCLSSSLKYVNHVNTLEMSNNRLSNKSIEKLVDNIKQNNILIKNLIKLNLGFNNISETGVENLIKFIEDKNCQLENLNLEGNNLGDININNLCNSISQSLGNRFNYINLGKNKITKNSEQGLLALTDKCLELVVLILRNNQINNLLAAKLMINIKNLLSLKMLDLSWNLIGDHLIYPFLFEEAVNFHPNKKNLFNNFELDKIKTNMKIIFNKNPLLPEIDKNQSSKTKNKNENEIEEINPEVKEIKIPQRKPSIFAEKFSSYIKNPLCPLIHINISHNNLPYEDCELIAESSKSNSSILGFHVNGNEMKIDQLGFITPLKKEQKNKSFFSKSQILYEAENYKVFPQILVSPINKIRDSNNCWVCECWNEIEFSLVINNKDIKPKYIVVKLHLDFENYSPCDMIYKKRCFKLVRMCPPGKVKYFFTVDGNPVYNCYKEFDYQIKEFEKPIKYSFNEEYIEQFNNIKFIDSEEEDDNNTNEIKNHIININKNYLGGDIIIDIQQDIRDKNNKLISKTIYINNYGLRYVTPNNNIITKDYQSTLKFSRPRLENISSRNEKQNPWKYADSIWYHYKYNYEGETDKTIEKMFEIDFEMSEYNMIFMKDNEFNLAKQLLKDNYRKFLNCYIYLSSYSGNPVWQITLNILIDWLKEKCGTFLDKDYNIKRIEKVIQNIYSNKKEIEERRKYKKYFPFNYSNLIRHNFMLFLVEITIDRFVNYRHQIESHYEAFDFSMNNFFINSFDNYVDYNIWRKERYYNEEIDNYIKAFLPLIDGVFQTFSKKLIEKREKELKERESLGFINNEINNDNKNLIDNEIKMTQEDFNALVMSFIDVGEFNIKEIPMIFHISKKFSVNELTNDNFLYLNFEEYCEALCRVIDIYSPYPPDEKKEDWPIEKRKEQTLIEKIENIMPNLFKKINHPKFNYIRDKFIPPLKKQITSLYIIDYNGNNFYKEYISIFEQNSEI